MYTDFYHITGKPFQLSPDPAFFFASKKHQQALSYLEYGLDQGEGFIVITGPIGSGKTTVAQNLLKKINDSNIEAIQIVTSNLTPSDLLYFIAKEFGLKPESRHKAYLLETIEQHLKARKNQGKRVLLLVDEAQNLPVDTVEELRMLSNFHEGNMPLIQSFLLGQEELKDILMRKEMEQFRQRIIASCHLIPLTQPEVKQYIEHRLALVGYDGPPMFDNESIELIQSVTKGTPRRINLLVDRIMLYGYLNNIKAFKIDEVSEVIDEIKSELSASLQQIGSDSDRQQAGQSNPVDHDTSFAVIQKHLLDTEEYLTERIANKVKMSRYLDKLIKRKRINSKPD